MSFLSGLICGLSMSSAQFAPPDVPKNHWAYPAVNELFGAGLLKGYPSEGKPPTLQASVPFDLKKATERERRWKEKKLLTVYPDVLIPGLRQEPSRYELAVMVQAVCYNLAQGTETVSWDVVRPELPEIADAVSMFQTELTKLGVDPKGLIADLQERRAGRVPALKLDSEAEFNHARLLEFLTHWQRLDLLGPYYRMFLNTRGGFNLQDANGYEEAILVYSVWTVCCEDVAKVREELPVLARAISMRREHLTKLGGDPEAMIEKLNRLVGQPALRFGA